jgi:uncharacterized iron-regulated protein
MALNVLRFLDQNPEATVIVLAGSGHAWKRGIPAQVRSRAAMPFRVILPQVKGRLEPDNVRLEDTDYLWLGLQER